VTVVAGEVMARLVERLAEAGWVAPDIEAGAVMEAARCLAPTPAEVEVVAERIAARRLGGEPLEHITGQVDFAGLRLVIGPGVYVPRAQTEPLALEAAARLASSAPPRRALDVGTGCGAIAAVLAQVDGAEVVATDVDPLALAWARRNAAVHRFEVIASDLFADVPPAYRGGLGVVTACLPYVPSGAMEYLPRDVLAHEPTGALCGGDDGLALVRRLIDGAAQWLAPAGWLLAEIGADQGTLCLEQLARAGFTDYRVVYDDEGDARRVEGRLA